MREEKEHVLGLSTWKDAVTITERGRLQEVKNKWEGEDLLIYEHVTFNVY